MLETLMLERRRDIRDDSIGHIFHRRSRVTVANARIHLPRRRRPTRKRIKAALNILRSVTEYPTRISAARKHSGILGTEQSPFGRPQRGAIGIGRVHGPTNSAKRSGAFGDRNPRSDICRPTDAGVGP